MNSPASMDKPAGALKPEPPWHSSGNRTRRAIDTSGLVLFHIAILGLIALSDPKAATAMALLSVPVLAMDATYFFSPPKRKAVLDPKPGPDNPSATASAGAFAPELLILLAPPVLFIAWLSFLVWQHHVLTQNELLAIVIALPAVVGLVSWAIRFRLTHYNVGIVSQTTKFIAWSMLGTWIGATFFFVVFLGAFLMKLFEP